MARKKTPPPLDLRQQNALMRPGNQVFIQRMEAVAHEIWMETTGPNANWDLVELRANELATMCQMRRVR